MGWLLPVGTPGGINSGFAGTPDGCGVVRRGTDLVLLEPHVYRLWAAAASARQKDDLAAWATAQSIPRAEDQLQELEDALLMIGEPGLKLRAGRIAIRLIGEIVGNGAACSTQFIALGQGGTKVGLDPYLFDLLLRTDGVTPISHYCESVDEIRRGQGCPSLLEALSDGLPPLVRTGVVRLDAATRSHAAS
jgi:hypothetical protein